MCAALPTGCTLLASVGDPIESDCRIINAALEPLRQVLEVAALLAKVLGEIFGAIVFALVALLEIFKRALIPIAQISFVSLAAFLAMGGIFFDFIERAFAHAALAVPLFGVVFKILVHEFRLYLIRVQAVAKDSIIQALEFDRKNQTDRVEMQLARIMNL